MGASLEIKCPVEGCSYTATFRLPVGEENGAGIAERRGILREEHPDHPLAEEPVDQRVDSN